MKTGPTNNGSNTIEILFPLLHIRSIVDVSYQWEIESWLLFLVVTQADIWLCHFQNTASKLAVFVIPLYLRSWKEEKKKT